jgi:hypothetical protein
MGTFFLAKNKDTAPYTQKVKLCRMVQKLVNEHLQIVVLSIL